MTRRQEGCEGRGREFETRDPAADRSTVTDTLFMMSIRAPHLRTFRDGWRTLRFFLMYSPRWLFLVPGAALITIGVLGYALALPGVTIGRVRLDAHTLLFASLAI